MINGILTGFIRRRFSPGQAYLSGDGVNYRLGPCHRLSEDGSLVCAGAVISDSYGKPSFAYNRIMGDVISCQFGHWSLVYEGYFLSSMTPIRWANLLPSIIAIFPYNGNVCKGSLPFISAVFAL